MQEALLPSAVRKRNGSTAVEIDIKKIPRDMGKVGRQLTRTISLSGSSFVRVALAVRR